MDAELNDSGKLVGTYRDLRVFQLAYPLTLEIHQASLAWPQHEQFRGLADQIRRSSKSITANMAEGFVKQRVSKAEFRRFIWMALGSASESDLWVSYAVDLGYLAADSGQEWQEKLTQIANMLRALAK